MEYPETEKLRECRTFPIFILFDPESARENQTHPHFIDSGAAGYC